MESEKKVSNLYKFMNVNTNNVGENRHTLEQSLFDGPKGLAIKLYQRKKTGEKDSALKVTIKEMEADKFGIRIKTNNTEEEKEVNMTKLKKFLQDNKDMAFALKYIEKDMAKFRKQLKELKGGGAYKKKKGSKKKEPTKEKKASKKKASRKKASRKNK